MGKPLRVLIVEDSADDAALLVRYLTRSGYELQWQRVDTANSMQVALDKDAWDIVIADHDMPLFSAPAALELVKHRDLDLPFIILSGAIDEEVAVAAMRSGAHDFLTKGNLARLVPAIERELREASERQDRRRSEEAIRFQSHLLDMVENSVVATDRDGIITYWNRFAEKMNGWSPEEAVGRSLIDLVAPHDRERMSTIIFDLAAGRSWSGEFSMQRKDGSIFPAMMTTSPVVDIQGSVTGFVGVSFDITERKQLETEREELLSREQAARADAEAAIRDLRRIQTVTDAALAHLEMSDLLPELLNRIRDALAVDNAAVLLTNDEQTHLTIYAARGPEEEVAQSVYIPIGRGFAGRIAATGEPRVIEDVAFADVVNPFLRERLRSLMGVPLRTEGQIIGVIHVGTVGPRKFTDSELRLLQVVADRAAMAIEQARLFDAERKARTAAQEAAQLREEFLAIASHELKTPLTGIKGYVQLMNRLVNSPAIDREEAVDLMSELDGQVVRLQALVSDLLDASQIARGQLELHTEQVDLSDLASRVVARFEIAPERTDKHRLTLDAPEPVVGMWDDLRLDQVLTNLLSNAIKYSPDGGEIRIAVAKVAEEAILTVSDQGIGISLDEQTHLFEPFVRGRGNRAIKGTGLGLFVVARIVRDHGGDIAVESSPGVGSTFTIRLPLRAESTADLSTVPHSL